jgi:hypothetical protein
MGPEGTYEYDPISRHVDKVPAVVLFLDEAEEPIGLGHIVGQVKQGRSREENPVLTFVDIAGERQEILGADCNWTVDTGAVSKYMEQQLDGKV